MQTECNLIMPECILLLNGVCYPKSDYVNLRANKTLEGLNLSEENGLEFGSVVDRRTGCLANLSSLNSVKD